MSISANLHRATEATANDANGTSWLTIRSPDGCAFNIFMPLAKAEAIAAVFNAPEADEVAK